MIISVDIQSNYGFFKKPDINETYLTYNTIHKPSILGIFGAVLGLKGFSDMNTGNRHLPEYYSLLADLKIGIMPLNHENGVTSKMLNKYTNTTGMANVSKEGKETYGATLIVEEQIIIDPKFRIFVYLDKENEHHVKLSKYLKNHETEYLYYMGKNDFRAYMDNYTEYKYSDDITHTPNIRLDTYYKKDVKIKDMFGFSVEEEEEDDKYFEMIEYLPIGYDINLFNNTVDKIFKYDMHLMCFTNRIFDSHNVKQYLSNVYRLITSSGSSIYVQLN